MTAVTVKVVLVVYVNFRYSRFLCADMFSIAVLGALYVGRYSRLLYSRSVIF